jgi:hypothetical protein
MEPNRPKPKKIKFTKEVRTYLFPNDLEQLTAAWRQTTSRTLTAYVRSVLLSREVIVNHRNQSIDELLAEMALFKTALTGLAEKYPGAVPAGKLDDIILNLKKLYKICSQL